MIVDKTVITMLDRQLCDKGNKKNGRLNIKNAASYMIPECNVNFKKTTCNDYVQLKFINHLLLQFPNFFCFVGPPIMASFAAIRTPL